MTLDEVRNLERRWNECVKDLPAGMVDLDSFTARLTPLREKLEAEAAADAVRSEQVLKLAAELTELAAGEDMELLRERKAAIEAEFAAIERVPKAAADRYNDAHRKAAARLGQHYETLDLARWESYTHKLDLCAELDKLAVVEDAELPKAAAGCRRSAKVENPRRGSESQGRRNQSPLPGADPGVAAPGG